jgi:hypothetical protein
VPLAEGRRFGFEFCRHDTLSIYAAFDVKSGKLIAKPVSRANLTAVLIRAVGF